MGKQKKREVRSSNGITLIALVVSIIVMMVLAGVSINATIGDNGIIRKTKEAKLAQEEAEWNEHIQMVLTDAYLGKDKIERLTPEEEALAGEDMDKIASMQKEKMRQYLISELSREAKEPVLVTAYEDGFLIVFGDKAIMVDNQLMIATTGINSSSNLLVETSEDWLFEANTNEPGTATLKAYNKEITGTITIPSVVTDKETGIAYVVSGLGDSIFSYGMGLTNIDFSKVEGKLKTIGPRVFMNCSNLEIAVPSGIPSSVTTIEDSAFSGCKKLSGNINEIMGKGYKLGKGVFAKCPNLAGEIQAVFDQNFYIGDDGNPVATVVEEGQFSGFSGLTGSLTIPNYITEIKANAFYGCTSISSLSFEEGSALTNIGDYAFYRAGMTNVVELPNSVTSIGNYVFSESTLTGIGLSNQLSSMGEYAFYNCRSLTGRVTFPATLEIISNDSFEYSAITEIYFEYDAINNKGCKMINNNAFQYCSSLKNISTSASSAENIISFPNTLEIINRRVFRVTGNIGVIYFPDSIIQIASQAFNSAGVIVEKWSNKLESIGSEAFINNRKLEKLPNTDSLITIESGAFSSCTNLGKSGESKTDIIEYLKNSKITILGDVAFENVKYINGNFTGEITNKNNQKITIQGAPFANTDVQLSKTISTTVNTIKANEFAGVTHITNVVEEGGNKVLTIPSNITKIGDYAFAGSSAFTKLVIPSSVTEIGVAAFKNCSTLKIVEFASDSPITILNNEIFMQSGIETIIWPPKLEKIKIQAFYHTIYLKEINIPNTVENIENNVFAYSIINKVILNEGLETIGNNVFAGTRIVDINIPNSVIKIGYAFQRMWSLKNITIGTGMKIIPKGLCGMPWEGDGVGELGTLETVTIKGEITSIGDYAFYNQPNLKSINGIDWSKINSIGKGAFYNCSSLKGNITLRRECTLFEDSFENCPLVITK